MPTLSQCQAAERDLALLQKAETAIPVAVLKLLQQLNERLATHHIDGELMAQAADDLQAALHETVFEAARLRCERVIEQYGHAEKHAYEAEHRLGHNQIL